MPSNFETGHVVNLSNFKLLIDNCAAFGAAYNPSNTRLSLANMTTLWTDADNAHQAMTLAVQQAKNPINDRQIVFEPLDKLVTRTLNYFNSTDASEQVKTDAKGLADRFRGYGTTVAKLQDGTPDPAHVSNSHQGYIQKSDTFKQLVDLYDSDGNYNPNETDIAIAALRSLATAMKTANDGIGGILAAVNTSRISRDKALYEETTGIVDTAMACKDYVKGCLEPLHLRRS